MPQAWWGGLCLGGQGQSQCKSHRAKAAVVNAAASQGHRKLLCGGPHAMFSPTWWAAGGDGRQGVPWMLHGVTRDEAVQAANALHPVGVVLWTEAGEPNQLHITVSVPPHPAVHAPVAVKSTAGAQHVVEVTLPKLPAPAPAEAGADVSGHLETRVICAASCSMLVRRVSEALGQQGPWQGEAREEASVMVAGSGLTGALGLGVCVIAGRPLAVDPVWTGFKHALANGEEACGRASHLHEATGVEEDEGGEDVQLATLAPPAPLVSVRVAAVAAGASHTLLLTQEGRVLATGANASGQLGLGVKRGVVLRPVEVPGLIGRRVLAVAAGSAHSLALVAQGDSPCGVGLWAWGQNEGGQCGLPGAGKQVVLSPHPVPIGQETGLQRRGGGGDGSSPAHRLAGIAAGGDTSFVWDGEGRAWGWGVHACGQAAVGAIGHEEQVHQPTPVQGLLARGEAVEQVACGGQHTLLLTRSGQVWAAGSRLYGRCGLDDAGQGADVFEPLCLSSGEDGAGVSLSLGAVRFTQVSAGADHSLALDAEGGVWAWGCGSAAGGGGHTLAASGGVALSSQHVYRPRQVMGVGPAVAVAAGEQHSLVLDGEGCAWGWGNAAAAGLLPAEAAPALAQDGSVAASAGGGLGAAPTVQQPQQLQCGPRCRVESIAAGPRHSVLIVAPAPAEATRAGNSEPWAPQWSPHHAPCIIDAGVADFRVAGGFQVPAEWASEAGSPAECHAKLVRFMGQQGSLRGAFGEELGRPSGRGGAAHPSSGGGSGRATSAARRAAVTRARSTSRGRRGSAGSQASAAGRYSVREEEVVREEEEVGVEHTAVAVVGWEAEGAVTGATRLHGVAPAYDSGDTSQTSDNPMAGPPSPGPTRGASATAEPGAVPGEGGEEGAEEWRSRGREESCLGALCRVLTCGLCAARDVED